MAAATAGRAALGGLRSNPSADGARSNPTGDAPRLQSPLGEGKPVALADITNTGRRNTTRSLSVADVVKENAKLIQLLNEKTRIIDVTRVEMQKLHLALQASRQQNLQLAQTNSQILAELNLGKDRLKALQHELSCTEALLKVKDSELEKKNKAANQRRKEVNSQDAMKVIPSKVQAVNSHRIDRSVTIAAKHHLLDSGCNKAVLPSTTACQEPPNDITTKRGRNKRKSESSECMKDPNVMQDHYRPHLQPVLSLDHEDPRRPVRRRSTRLNPGSLEVTEVSCSKLPEDDVVPSAAPSNFCEPTTEEDMRNTQKNESSRGVVTASGSKKIEINEQPRKEENFKEVQDVPGMEAHQIGASLPFKIIEASKALEDAGNERVTNKHKFKSGKDSTIEHIDAKCDSSTREPLHQDEKRKSQRRKSSRLDSVLSENTSTSETLYEDVIAPCSMEQTINQNQTDECSSTKATEGQVTGRRSLRRAAEKVVSYKEIPLNVKMRRP